CEVLELGGIGHVAADGERARAEAPRARGRGLDLGLRARGADEVRAHLGEGERDRLPDAAPRAGDDRDLVGQAEAIEERHGGARILLPRSRRQPNLRFPRIASPSALTWYGGGGGCGTWRERFTRRSSRGSSGAGSSRTARSATWPAGTMAASSASAWAARSTRSRWSRSGTGAARYIRRGRPAGSWDSGRPATLALEVRPDVRAGRHDARALVRLVGILAQQLELLHLPRLNRDQRSVRSRPVQAAVAAGYPCPWRKLGRVVQLHGLAVDRLDPTSLLLTPLLRHRNLLSSRRWSGPPPPSGR